MSRITPGGIGTVAASITPSGTQDVNLTQISGSSFSLGQQLAAASLPVVLTAAQLATLTPLATVAVTQSTSPWIVAGSGTAGSAATGVVTIQGIASMTPVQVSQATASNLNATVVGTGTFAVQAASATAPVMSMNSSSANSGLNAAIAGVFDDAAPTSITENNFGFIRMSANRNLYNTIRDAAGNERGANVDSNNNLGVVLAAETTKVIGTARILGNSGATLDSTVGAGTAPTNQVVVGAIYNSTEISPTTGQAFALQADSKGRLRGVIMDAAGNTRGANVNASNQLSVTVDAIVSTTKKISYGTYTAVTVTNLQSLASSATAGWQSGRIDNQTSVKATDYEIFVKLTTANTAPANDKAAYIYISSAMTTDGGTTWLHADQGTTTLPTGTEGTTTIASPNNLKLLGVLSYTTQQMTMQGNFNLANAVGQNMPDGFSIIIINFTGAALSTNCVVAYRAINVTQS